MKNPLHRTAVAAALALGVLLSSPGLAGPPGLATPGGGSDSPPPIDCNANGLDDFLEILDGTGKDCNRNGILDACDLGADRRHLDLELGINFGDGKTPVLVVDLDGDGRLDIAASSFDGVHLHRNVGDGRTYLMEKLSISTPPSGLAAGDPDADGDVDLAVGHTPVDQGNGVYGGGGLTVFANRGAGKLEAALDLPQAAYAGSVVQADLDGDGRPELAGTDNFGNDLIVYRNDGGLAFSVARRVPVGTGPSGLAAADLDADGRLDLATAFHAGEESHPATLLNRGAEGFVFKDLGAMGKQIFTVRTGDLDGDGRPDIAVSIHGLPGVGLLWNRGGGSFGEGQVVPTQEDLSDVDLVDLNRDALPDLVVANVYARKVSVFGNRGGRSFSGPEFHTTSGGPYSLAHGDLDADGLPDVVAGRDNGISILFGLWGRARSRDEDRDGIPDECQGVAFHRGDPDADGEASISDPVRLLIFLFQGMEAPSCLDSADSNGDGSLDITDAIHLLAYLFQGGSRPPLPGPPGDPCGVLGGGILGCVSYPPCAGAW